MYINPFVAGVIATLVGEFIAISVYVFANLHYANKLNRTRMANNANEKRGNNNG